VTHIRRIGQENESGHSRLDDDARTVGYIKDNSFAKTPHSGKSLPNQSPPQVFDGRYDRNRFAVVGTLIDSQDGSARDMFSNSSNHRFHFGKFWQNPSPGEKIPNGPPVPVPIDFLDPTRITSSIILAASLIVGMLDVDPAFSSANSQNLLDVATRADDSNPILHDPFDANC
jgi:hypothetical protein